MLFLLSANETMRERKREKETEGGKKSPKQLQQVYNENETGNESEACV